jgi:hypothetical protein
LCELLIICCDQSSIPARAEILSRKETETSHDTDVAYELSSISGADCLRGIFGERDIAASANFDDRVQVRGKTEEVDRNDGARSLGYGAGDLRGIHVERVRPNVDKYGRRPQADDSADRRDERERRRYSFIPGPDAKRHQGEQQRV